MTIHPDPRCGDCKKFDYNEGIGNTWPKGRCEVVSEHLLGLGYPADLDGYEVTATTPCKNCPDFSLSEDARAAAREEREYQKQKGHLAQV